MVLGRSPGAASQNDTSKMVDPKIRKIEKWTCLEEEFVFTEEQNLSSLCYYIASLIDSMYIG